MTYCVGMRVNEGLAMIADTRTNAGVDNISSYKKLHVVQEPDRILALATAGNLSVTQTALALVRQGVRLPDSGEEPETLGTAPNLFRCAQLIGFAIKQVRRELAPSLQAESVKADATILMGGQIAGDKMRLYLIYSQGNFIECGPDTPYFQVGELKYGKPILDRTMEVDTPLSDAVKVGLLSFDSTVRSNVAVAPPFDMIVIKRGELTGMTRRIEADDPYFIELGHRWSKALIDAQRAIPPPPWMAG